MELFKLFGTIAINNQDAINGINETTGHAEGAGSKIVSAFKKIGTAVVTYLAVDKIKDFGLAMIQASADAQAMESQFTQVFGEMEGNASDSLSAIADQTGVLENRMKGSYTKIAAFAKTSGMDTADALDLANRSMIAIADSAAFYDRSLEDTTESLQSFLKGNYENDSALGISCTETTRNAKANELYGQSFKDLSESQKQLTLLAMVEEANELSGAMGQASRESDTWTNQTGNLKQAWTDFLAVIGSPVLKLAIPIVKGLADGVAWLTEKVKGGNISLKSFLDYFGLTETVMPIIESIKTGFSEFIELVKPFVEEHIAGLQEGFQTLGQIWQEVILPAIETIVGWFTEFVTIIGESVAPAIESIAEKFFEFRDILMEVLQEYVIPFVSSFVQMIQQLYTENQDKLQKIGTLFQTIFDAIAGLVAWFVDTFKNYILPFFQWLVICVQDNMGNIKDFFQSVFDIIGGIIDFFINLFQGNWSGMWESIKSILSSALEAVENAFYTALSVICNIFSPLTNFFSGIWSGIKGVFSAVGSWFSEKFTSAYNSVKNAFSSIGSFFQGVWNNIKNMFSKVGSAVADGITGAVKSAVNGVLSGAINIINGFISAINAAIGVINAIPGVSISKLSELEVPQLAEGGILEKGEVGLLEGDGAEAVVPLHNNKKWISAVAEDMDSAMGGKSSEKLDKVVELLEQLVEFMPELANISIILNNREFGRAVRQVN